MKTIIFCGGQGTRIRGVADNLPKPLLPIGNRPILWHIMNFYAAYGHKDFILCLGYLGWHIKEYFMNYMAMNNDFEINLRTPEKIRMLDKRKLIDWNITFAETGEQTQTAGRILKIARHVEDEKLVMLTYGDGVSNVNLKELIKFHIRHKKTATITGVRPSSRFGEIEYKEGGRISKFNEKPQTTRGRINGGYMIFNAKKLLSYLPASDQVVFEREPLMQMAEDGELFMYAHNGFWQPMDTYREYKLLNEIWEKGSAPWDPGSKKVN